MIHLQTSDDSTYSEVLKLLHYITPLRFLGRSKLIIRIIKRKIGASTLQIKEHIVTIYPMTAPKPAHTPITRIGPPTQRPIRIRQYIILFTTEMK